MNLNPPIPRRRRKGEAIGDPPLEPENVHRNVVVWTTGPDGPKPRSLTEADVPSQTWPSKMTHE